MGTHTRGKGSLIAAGMTPQDEVEGIPDDLFVSQRRESLVLSCPSFAAISPRRGR